MRLSIITINYNSAESTIKLLDSFVQQTDKDFQVVLVDNDSNDVEKLLSHTTSENNLVFIRNHHNLGFSGGNNMGIKKALEMGSDWVLLLNNDTWLENDFVARLKANLEGKEGILGLALDEEGSIAYGGKIKWLEPTLKHIRNSNRTKDSDIYAIGGGMAIHRSVFEKIGFLDESYFLYFEDADFSFRSRGAGFLVSILDEPKAHHQVSTTTRKLGSPLLLRYHYRNALYFNWKNGPWYIKLLVWSWSWWVATKQIVKILVNKNRKESIAILKGIGDWYAGKMGKIAK